MLRMRLALDPILPRPIGGECNQTSLPISKSMVSLHETCPSSFQSVFFTPAFEAKYRQLDLELNVAAPIPARSVVMLTASRNGSS